MNLTTRRFAGGSIHDGWKIGTLCHWYHDEVANGKPKPTDYAYAKTNEVCDDCNTDEDPSLALPDTTTPTATANVQEAR